MDRIVASGIGCVSSLGVGYADLSKSLIAGRSGIRELSLFETHGAQCRWAAEVPALDFGSLLPGIDLKGVNRTTLFALLASRLAFEDAGIILDEMDRSRIAVVLGTAQACFGPTARFYEELSEFGSLQVNPVTFANTPINVPTARVAMSFGLNGPNTTISNGQTSSLKALAYACDLLRLGQADVVLAGGAESLSWEKYAAYHTIKALAGQKRGTDERCAPFSSKRTGSVLGEGSAMFVLQTHKSAQETGAPVRFEFAGFGFGSHKRAAGAGRAPACAIRAALEESQTGAGEVDLVVANANGSILDDRLEAKALKSVFGRESHHLAVSAIKGATGELRGASGALHVAAASAAIEANLVLPTLNLGVPDGGLPRCQIASHALAKRIDTVVVNSIEPLADSSSLVLKRWESAAA